MHHSLQFYRAGDLNQAELACRRQLDRDPQAADAWHLLGVVVYQRGRHPQAIEYMRRSIAIKPYEATYHSNLGLLYQTLKQPELAEACFRQALAAQPESADAQERLGRLLSQQRRHGEAAACFQAALRLDPRHVAARIHLAVVCGEQGQFDAAVEHSRRAIELDPRQAVAHFNLGVARKEQLRLKSALAAFQQAIALDANYADAHFYRAMTWLALGDFEHGWPEYEWRWRQPGTVGQLNQRPRWLGTSLAERTILLYSEQGLGDSLQFIRFAEPLHASGARVVLRCPQALGTLLAHCPFIDQVLGPDDPLPACDYVAPLGSLPGLLNTRLDTIPNRVPYLSADEKLVSQWRTELSGCAGLKIGVCWQGNPRHRVNAARSFPLAYLLRLSRLPGVQLFSLQKGHAAAELSRAEPSAIVDLSGRLHDFHDTAAAMQNMDLVLTCDSSPAHLAGALGVRVWTALHFAADWRWLVGRDDSPWYPTMRLFRQERAGDWLGVFGRIEKGLGEMINAKC